MSKRLWWQYIQVPKYQHLIWVSGLAHCLNFNFSTSQRQEFAFIEQGVASRYSVPPENNKTDFSVFTSEENTSLVSFTMSTTVHHYPQELSLLNYQLIMSEDPQLAQACTCITFSKRLTFTKLSNHIHLRQT